MEIKHHLGRTASRFMLAADETYLNSGTPAAARVIITCELTAVLAAAS